MDNWIQNGLTGPGPLGPFCIRLSILNITLAHLTYLIIYAYAMTYKVYRQASTMFEVLKLGMVGNQLSQKSVLSLIWTWSTFIPGYSLDTGTSIHKRSFCYYPYD